MGSRGNYVEIQNNKSYCSLLFGQHRFPVLQRMDFTMLIPLVVSNGFVVETALLDMSY